MHELMLMFQKEERLERTVKLIQLFQNTGDIHHYEQVKQSLPALSPRDYNRVLRLAAEIIGV